MAHGPTGTAITIVVAVVGLVAAVTAARVVAPGERLVVLRFGRAHRERSDGLAFVLPLLERTVSVPVRPLHLHPREVPAVTRDGYRVRIRVEATCRATDVTRLAEEEADPYLRGADLLEATVRDAVRLLDLADLVERPDPAGVRAADRTGVELTEIRAGEIELALTTDLVRLLDGQSGRRRG